MSVRKILNSLGLREIGSLLVKRGTAMGPLVPSLLISLVLLFFSWLFESTLVIGGIPLITVACVLVALGLIINYNRHYARFAKHDPDRLQSEEYRYEIARLKMIATKELSDPMPADELPLADTAPKLSEPEESLTSTDDKEQSS